MPTIDATPGGANSNSYETAAEADTYFDSRPAIVPPWPVPDDDAKARLLIFGTKILDSLAQPFKTLVPAQGGVPAYYRVRRYWTGAPATTTQKLAWPRIGMFDKNGNAIAVDVIPDDLKDALSEIAGFLIKSDPTLNNDVIIQGLTSVKAGSVALTFKDNITPQVIPDWVYNLFPVEWLTEEGYESALKAEFGVVSRTSRRWPSSRRGGC